jgi:hypothetical protein
MHVLKRQSSTRRSAGAVALAGALLLAGPALAQDHKPALLFEHHGFASFMIDEKDQAFENALAMLPARLHELRDEIPDLQDFPEPVMDLLFDLAPRPMQMAVLPMGMDPNTGAPAASIVLSFGADSQRDAIGLADRIHEMIDLSGEDVPLRFSDEDDTLRLIDTPGGPISFGPTQGADGWAFQLAFGPHLDLDDAFATLEPVPAGVRPVMRGRLDMQVLSPFISMAIGMGGGHEGQMILSQLMNAGLLGPDAIALEFGMIYTKDAMVSRFVVERAGLAQDAGYVKEPLTADAFRIIPQDASVLGLSQWDAMSLWTMFEGIADYAPDFDLEEIRGWARENLGVDPKDDFLEPLGTTWCWYSSDTTGGDTLLAGVLAVSLDDEAHFRATMEELGSLANSHIEEEIPYVRLAKTEMLGEEIYALQFRGLPIPLELCAAIQDGHFLVAMTPQAACAAVKQMHGEGSILDNPTFRRAAPVDMLDRLVAFSYMDNAELANCGYPLMQLAGSAVANAMRSPHGDRDPGVLVPLYNDFVDDVRPLVAVSYWDGDDFVQEMRSDRSVLVNKASMIGYLGRSPIAPMVVGGMLLGAGAGALDGMHIDLDDIVELPGSTRSEEMKSMSQVRNITMGMHIYAVDSGDQTPNSIQQLLDEDFLDAEILVSPFGPVWDDDGDYLLRGGLNLSRLQDPWRVVAVYDRAMYANHERVAVGYADSHVELLTINEFQQLLGIEANADYDWQLPER